MYAIIALTIVVIALFWALPIACLACWLFCVMAWGWASSNPEAASLATAAILILATVRDTREARPFKDGCVFALFGCAVMLIAGFLLFELGSWLRSLL